MCLPSGEGHESGGEVLNWEPTGALNVENKASWLGGACVVGDVDDDDAGDTVVVEVAVDGVLEADEKDPYPE